MGRGEHDRRAVADAMLLLLRAIRHSGVWIEHVAGTMVHVADALGGFFIADRHPTYGALQCTGVVAKQPLYPLEIAWRPHVHRVRNGGEGGVWMERPCSQVLGEHVVGVRCREKAE